MTIDEQITVNLNINGCLGSILGSYPQFELIWAQVSFSGVSYSIHMDHEVTEDTNQVVMSTLYSHILKEDKHLLNKTRYCTTISNAQFSMVHEDGQKSVFVTPDNRPIKSSV